MAIDRAKLLPRSSRTTTQKMDSARKNATRENSVTEKQYVDLTRSVAAINRNLIGISNLLKFNKNVVEREYYVNDYGNQISHFNYSVYLRIRENLYDEKFPPDNPDLYPGDYLKDIANNIIKNNKDINFENFNDIEEHLK